MVRIIKHYNYCQISDEYNLDIWRALDRELSFEVKGAEFSRAYKGYFNAVGDFVSWDGRRHLMSSSGKFPYGLLQRVMGFYQSINIFPDIIDTRIEKQPTASVDISVRLRDIGKIPREYQLLASDIATNTDRGIIRLPTGSGKTLVAALITAKLGKPTIVLVIGIDLLYQFYDFFSEIFGKEIGIIGDGKCEIRDINIATVWSVGQAIGLKNYKSLDDENETEKKIDPSKFRDIKSMILRSKVIILDECHISSANTIQGIAKELKAEYVYGMSASPWRDDGADLLIEAFLGNKIIDISARELISKGYLVRPNIKFLAPESYKFKSGAFPKIYSKYIVENEQRNEMITRGAVSMVEQGFLPLVLFHSIKHGDVLFERLKGKIPTALLSGKDSSKVRQKIKDQLQDGKLKCIIASKIFDMGIDLPILSGLVIAGAGKSSVRALQRIGRVIRPFPGKKMAAVLDFADQAPYLIDHALARKAIYETEFDVTWPQEKTKKESSPG